MNKEEIQRFIQDNRATAQTQARRWEGVDPSRLLQALDYLEQMLGQHTPAVADQGIEMVARQVSISSPEPWMQGVEVCIELEKIFDIPTAERLVDLLRANKGIRILL